MTKPHLSLTVVPDAPTPAETAAFLAALRDNLATGYVPVAERGEGGIGTLGEKRLHAVMKSFCSAEPATHEVKLGGGTRYTADVLSDNVIYEIQTGSFRPLPPRLNYYLEHTPCDIVVVKPIPKLRWMRWMEPDTGELSTRRRVPRAGDIRDFLSEVYYLIPYLPLPRFSVRLVFLEVEDFKWRNGKSRDGKHYGAERYERIPLSLLGTKTFRTPADYRVFLPDTDLLPGAFTAPEYAIITGINGRATYGTLRALCAMGLLAQTDMRGRAMVFERI